MFLYFMRDISSFLRSQSLENILDKQEYQYFTYRCELPSTIEKGKKESCADEILNDSGVNSMLNQCHSSRNEMAIRSI